MRSKRKNSSLRILTICACLVLTGVLVAGCSSRAQRAKNYYEHGKTYLAEKNYPKARIELRNAVQNDPKMVEAWRELAKVDEHDRNWSSLTESLRRIVELDKKDVKARVQLAKLYLLGGSLDQALKMANAANEIEPENPNVLALKAAVLFRLKDIDGTKKEAEKALKIDPGNPEANVVLATERLLNEDYSGALKFLDKVSADHQNDLGVMLVKINAFDKLGDLKNVESTYLNLIDQHPKDIVFKNLLIKFYLAHKRPNDAEQLLRNVVAADPKNINAELELVNLLGYVKGPSAAHAELTARIKAGGDVFPLQLALAKLDFAQGNTSAGIDLLKELSADKNESRASAAKITLAQYYLGKNDKAAAEPLIKNVLDADNHNPEALRLRALIRLNNGKTDDAINDLRTALNDQPNSVPLLLTLASAYERKGTIDLADRAYSDAMKASRYAPAVGFDYIAFLTRRGMADQVDNILTQLATRNPNNIAVLTALAKSKLAHHDWIAAQNIAAAIRRMNSKSAVASQILGAALVGQRKLNDSLSVLEEAYNQNPSAQPMAELVGVYMQAGQAEKAKSFLHSVLQANPRNAEALALLGSIDVSEKNLKQAESDFKSAIEKEPKATIGYVALARLYAGENKVDDAIKVLKDGLSQQSKNFALRLNLAGLFEHKNVISIPLLRFMS